jgi:hypothetical protein
MWSNSFPGPFAQWILYAILVISSGVLRRNPAIAAPPQSGACWSRKRMDPVPLSVAGVSICVCVKTTRPPPSLPACPVRPETAVHPAAQHSGVSGLAWRFRLHLSSDGLHSYDRHSCSWLHMPAHSPQCATLCPPPEDPILPHPGTSPCSCSKPWEQTGVAGAPRPVPTGPSCCGMLLRRSEDEDCLHFEQSHAPNSCQVSRVSAASFRVTTATFRLSTHARGRQWHGTGGSL